MAGEKAGGSDGSARNTGRAVEAGEDVGKDGSAGLELGEVLVGADKAGGEKRG